jgi:hypothetical protein
VAAGWAWVVGEGGTECAIMIERGELGETECGVCDGIH